MNNINNQIRHFKLRESKRKLVGLEITRRKRAELNDLINKELRIKNGAENLLNVCNNPKTKERLKLELTFVESKIEYLKDQLSELNCDFTLYKMKHTNNNNNNNNNKTLINSNQHEKLMNSLSCSSASSNSSYGSKKFQNLPEILVTPSSSNEPIVDYYLNSPTVSSVSCSILNSSKSTDLMIYLNLKETTNLDFSKGFREFISTHYREDPSNYSEQIRQLNYFRESTIRLSYEPSLDSIKRLFEYYNSLFLIEKRFFQDSKCNNVYFSWFDSINGVESTQKSIQFEKAAIMFNCATLFTQLAAICCDGNDQKLDEELSYWQRATGCLQYLNSTFTNSPNLDMSSFVLSFFIETFKCQAYETKAKYLITNSEIMINSTSGKYDPKQVFLNYVRIAKIYAHISEAYNQMKIKLDSNITVKNYLPEIWYNLIKIKAIYYKGLSHYYSASAIITHGIENISDNLQVQIFFDSLHDKNQSKLKSTINASNATYFHKRVIEQQKLYDINVLKDDRKYHLARAHFRDSSTWHEEAMRQHSLCRKFSKDDYLYTLLRYYHELSLDKFMQLENIPSDGFESELFEVFPINTILDDELKICLIEPNFQQYESKDFFNLIGPLKVYSSELEISIPFTCVLKKNQNSQSLGLTVKGDCPVRVNQVDPKSLAYEAGIREGDYIIAIQDQDVRWSKHCQVVEKIRSFSNIVKLTLINTQPRPKVSSSRSDELNSFNKTQSTKSALYKQFSSLNTSQLKSPKMSKSSIRLFSIGKKTSLNNSIPTNDKTIAFEHSPIIFNREDDEIYHDRESMNFWQHFKTVKIPSFTNTITLGRKFKRNVLKMSIFSTFSINNENASNKTVDSANIANNLDNNLSVALKDLWSNEKTKKSYSRNKILRNNKQKKLLQKALDSTQNNLNNNININHNNSNNNNNFCNKNGRLLSYQSNLYKTL